MYVITFCGGGVRGGCFIFFFFFSVFIQLDKAADKNR